MHLYFDPSYDNFITGPTALPSKEDRENADFFCNNPWIERAISPLESILEWGSMLVPSETPQTEWIQGRSDYYKFES